MNLPKITNCQMCEQDLCTVRYSGDTPMVRVKKLDESFEEIPFADIQNTDTYEGSPIERLYSSGHIFIDETRKKVFLITVQKETQSQPQHQFTGGAPKEDIYKDIIKNQEDTVVVNTEKAAENAKQRTKKRTSVYVQETHNHTPLVDWAMLEQKDSWKLVCLMHWVVKKYEGILAPQIGMEDVIWGDWFTIDTLSTTPHIAPNAELVTKEALKLIKK